MHDEPALQTLLARYPALTACADDIQQAYEVLRDCFAHDGKLLVAGNGGSAADAEHMAGELLKRFKQARPIPQALADKLKAIDPVRGEKLSASLERSLMTIPLVSHEGLITAFLNDVGAEGVYAQQVLGYGRPGDVFFGISTSGNSENILQAQVVAKALGMKVILLTGRTGGKCRAMADIAIRAPEQETFMVQEYHLPIYHCICLMLETHFFGKGE